jgi:hypothetical protein
MHLRYFVYHKCKTMVSICFSIFCDIINFDRPGMCSNLFCFAKHSLDADANKHQLHTLTSTNVAHTLYLYKHL